MQAGPHLLSNSDYKAWERNFPNTLQPRLLGSLHSPRLSLFVRQMCGEHTHTHAHIHTDTHTHTHKTSWLKSFKKEREKATKGL